MVPGLKQRVVKHSLLPVRIRHHLRSVGAADGLVFFYLPDPATNEVLGNVPEMGLSETTAAIEAAAKAFIGWSKTTAKVRPKI